MNGTAKKMNSTPTTRGRYAADAAAYQVRRATEEQADISLHSLTRKLSRDLARWHFAIHFALPLDSIDAECIMRIWQQDPKEAAGIILRCANASPTERRAAIEALHNHNWSDLAEILPKEFLQAVEMRYTALSRIRTGEVRNSGYFPYSLSDGQKVLSKIVRERYRAILSWLVADNQKDMVLYFDIPGRVYRNYCHVWESPEVVNKSRVILGKKGKEVFLKSFYPVLE